MGDTVNKCERCGAKPGGFNLLDYCTDCSRDLCGDCMQLGCCGNVPAISGMAVDFADEPSRTEE